jgi:DNA-binding CsgD family transcriptional regulator
MDMATTRAIRFSALGWGFLTAWGVEGMLMGTILNSSSFVPAGLVASASNIVTLAAIALLLGFGTRRGVRGSIGAARVFDSSTHPVRWPAVLAAALMLCGSSGNLLGQALNPTLKVLELGSLALASSGYVLLTVLWGRYYASRDSQEIETYAVWSTFLCAVLYLLALVLPTPALIVIWLCLPPTSCACLLLSERRTEATTPQDEYGILPDNQKGTYVPETEDTAVFGTKKRPLLPYWWFGISILAASFCITLPTGSSTLSALPRGALGFTTLSGLVFAVILVVYCIVFARRINLATFYRLLCPLTVGGLFLIALPSPIMAFVGFGLIFAAQWVLYLSVWIYLAELCHKMPVSPVLVFATGRLMFELGFLLAYLLDSTMATLTVDRHIPFVFIAFGIAVLFVLTALIPLNSDEAHEAHEAHEGQPVSPAQDAAAPEAPSDRKMLTELFQKQTQRLARRYMLSPREGEIAQYLVRGYSLPSIRNELFIARSTIDSHVQRIYRKCDIHSRQELIALFDQVADEVES